ncbi:hypothetical protein D3C76_1450020 [compost metagenome]
MEAVGLGPAQAEANAQAAHFRGRVHRTRILSHVKTRDTDFACDANNAHQRIEHCRRSFVFHASMTVSTRLEPHRVDGAIHFGFPQQRSDLFVQRGVCR